MYIREMKENDISAVLPIYLEYYNGREGGCWTEKTAGKRIHQVVSMEDAYSLLLETEDKVIGFVMGYLKQYDDIVGYTLEEIVIASEYQNQGMGSCLLKELEKKVREKGAALIELQAVNDALHEHFYGKAGYYDASNFVLKAKWLK